MWLHDGAREDRPCSGFCTPSGRRSCRKRSVHPRGTTERLQLRKIQPERSSTGGACFMRNKAHDQHTPTWRFLTDGAPALVTHQ